MGYFERVSIIWLHWYKPLSEAIHTYLVAYKKDMMMNHRRGRRFAGWIQLAHIGPPLPSCLCVMPSILVIDSLR